MEIVTLLLNILFLVLGFAFLIKGADIFVDGASAIAKILKVPALIIGLTIVALGTSLPELAVSIVAAVNNSTDLSVSNVVGSNIFNILVVLGLTSILVPIAIEKKVLKFELPFVLGVSTLLLILGFIGNSEINWVFGLIFLVLLAFYIFFLIKRTKKEEPVEQEDNKTSSELEENKTSPFKAIIFLVLGAGLIMFGGECVNKTSVVIAEYFGMEEQLIGLTIVAIGTSLPELITSLVAAKKGENDIALGNVIGSNTLNILFILGAASLITPLPISPSMTFDMVVMVLITLVLIIMAILTSKKKGLTKTCGFILVSLYIIYTAYIICRNYGVLPF